MKIQTRVFMYVEHRKCGICVIKHTKKLEMVYVLKCNMQFSAAINHHLEIA